MVPIICEQLGPWFQRSIWLSQQLYDTVYACGSLTIIIQACFINTWTPRWNTSFTATPYNHQLSSGNDCSTSTGESKRQVPHMYPGLGVGRVGMNGWAAFVWVPSCSNQSVSKHCCTGIFMRGIRKSLPERRQCFLTGLTAGYKWLQWGIVDLLPCSHQVPIPIEDSGCHQSIAAWFR